MKSCHLTHFSLTEKSNLLSLLYTHLGDEGWVDTVTYIWPLFLPNLRWESTALLSHYCVILRHLHWWLSCRYAKQYRYLRPGQWKGGSFFKVQKFWDYSLEKVLEYLGGNENDVWNPSVFTKLSKWAEWQNAESVLYLLDSQLCSFGCFWLIFKDTIAEVQSKCIPLNLINKYKTLRKGKRMLVWLNINIRGKVLLKEKRYLSESSNNVGNIC